MRKVLVAVAALLMIAGIALGAGLVCQLVLLGTQGAFAQVLPVPGGRSIRGPAAVFTGAALLFALGCGGAAAVLGLEQVGLFASLLTVVSGLLALTAIATYVWCWPAALRDFAEEH